MAQALVVDVSARTVAFEESMKRAADTAKQQMGSIGKSVDSISSNFSSLAKTVQVATAAIGAIGAIASIGFLKNLISETADAADRIDDLSKQTGIAHERLSGLAYQSKLTGSNLDGAVSSVARLNKNMAEAVVETSRQAKAFKALDISVKESDGSLKSTDKMISELSDKFASYADGPEKAALAQEIFGRSGAAMVPLLNEGSAALEKMQQDVNKYGLVTRDVAYLTSRYNDEVDRMKMMLSGVMLSITASILPAFAGMSDSLAWLIDHSEGVKAALVGLATVVATFSFSPLITGLTAVTKAVITFTAALLTNPVFLFAAAIGAAGAALYYFRDTTIEVGDTTTSISEIALGAWESVKNGFGAAADYISDAGNRMANDFGVVGAVIVDVFSNTFNFAKNFINSVIGLFVSLSKVIGIVAGSMIDTFTNGFSRIKNLAVSLWDGIKKVFSGDFSFSAFTDALKEEGNRVLDTYSQIGEAIGESMTTDYLGAAKDIALGMAESLALAGREAKKLNEELSGADGGKKPAAPSIFTEGGVKAASENIEKQIALAKEGYDRVFAIASAAISRELDILSEQHSLKLVSERDYITRRGDLQEQAARANAERLEKTYNDLSAYLQNLQLAPKIDEKQQEKIKQAVSKTQKAYDDWQESIKKVSDVSRKTANDLAQHNQRIQQQIKDLTADNEKFIKSLNKRVEDLKFENSLIGLSTSAQQKLRAEREIQLQVAERIEEVEKRIAEILRSDPGADMTKLYEQREEIAQAGLEAIQRIDQEMQNKDWAETFSSMSDSITDAIFRGFEKGASFVDNLKDTLTNTFKTMVLKPVISAVVTMTMSGISGIAAAMTGSSGGVGGASGAGGGGILDSLLNLGSSGSNIMNLFTGGGAFGSGLGWSIATSGIGQALGLSTQVAGAGATYALTGFGSALSTAIPYVGLGLGLISMLSGIFGRKGGEKTGGFFADLENIDRYYTPDQQDDYARDVVERVRERFGQLFGSTDGLNFGFGFDQDPKGDAGSRTAGGVYFNGERIYFNRDDWGRDAEDFQAGLELEIQRMMLAAARAVTEGDARDVLGDFDIGDAAADVVEQALSDVIFWMHVVEPMRGALETAFGQAFTFKEIDALSRSGETLQETISRLNKVFTATNIAARITNQSVSDLFGVGLSGADARSSFASLFGDEDTMLNQVTAYMQTFRASDYGVLITETLGQELTSTFAHLGMEVPRTIDEFNQLVQGLDLTTESGRETFAALMGVSSQFDQFIGAIERLGQSFQDSIDSARQQVETVGLSQQELYDYYQTRGNAAYDNFINATSIEEAERYFNEAMAYYMQAFNTLGEDGQITMRDTFLASLDMIEEAYQDVLARIRDDALASGAEVVSGETEERQKTILDVAAQQISEASSSFVKASDGDLKAAAQMQTSAQTMGDAASAMIAAANGMITALGNINVNAHVTLNNSQAVGQ